MKKHTLHLLAISALICLTLTACGQSTNTIETEESESTTVIETEQFATSEPETVESETNETKESVEVACDIPEGLYRDFLNNETEAIFNATVDKAVYFDNTILNGNAYTLEELVKLYIDYFQMDGELDIEPTIEYTLLDCGNDGTPELAIQLHANIKNIEDFSDLIVLKEKNDTLEAVYAKLGWGRNIFSINKYGYIARYGSGGAATTYYDKELIDADGEYHFLYSNVVNGWSGIEDYLTDDTKGHPKEDFVYLGFTFDENAECYPYYPVSSYAFLDRSTEVWGDIAAFTHYCYSPVDYIDSIYEPGYCIRDFLDSEGVQVYNIKDVEQMIADKEKSEGLTEEIKNASEVEWKPLDNYDE